MNVTGNITITGNINATGNLNYDNVTNLVVGDPLVYFGANNQANVYDLGYVVAWNDGTYQHGGFVRDASDGIFKLFGNVVSEPTTTIDFTNAVYQPIHTGSATFAGANINGALTGATTMSATGTITGGNIATGGTVSATGNVTGGNLITAGLASVTGNITGGNLITAGLVSLSSITKTGSNAVGNIGSSSNYFNTVFAQATSALYADLAEMYVADANYEPGTVVAFGGAFEVTQSGNSADPRVAGVVSTNPSYLMNSAQDGEFVVAVALTGRVPTKVTGTVQKGDMMVSNGDGSARAEADPRVGTVIGKALEDFNGVAGIIEVVVGRL